MYTLPTITPADDEPVPVYQSTPVVETIPTITPVEPEVQYVEEPQIQYVEEPQIQYVEQPQIEYVEQPQEVVIPQPVAQPVPVQQDDLTKYYNILDQFGPVESGIR